MTNPTDISTPILSTLRLPDPETVAHLVRMAEKQGHPLSAVRLFALNREAAHPGLMTLLASGKCWAATTKDGGHLFVLLPRERAVLACHHLNFPEESRAEYLEAMASEPPPDSLRLLIVETTCQGDEVSCHVNWGTVGGVRTPAGPVGPICPPAKKEVN